MASDSYNLGWLLGSDFLLFFFACLEATKPISLMFTFAEIFTILMGLYMFSSPYIPVRFSLLRRSITCFGVNVMYYVLKLY